MSRFGWIFVSYLIYVSGLMLSNGINSAFNKPILATGYLTSWWFFSIVFLMTYTSEWIAIILNKEG